jgi:hypothetical protein
MRRTLVLVLSALACTGAVAGGARTDGLPVLGIDVGAQGVAVGPARYVTLPVGPRTLLARIATRDGQVRAHRLLPGTFTIPAVAYDATSGGLSANGRRLVLIEPRTSFPRAETALAVVDATRLRVDRIVRLRGDFSFDAVSPDGHRAYLVHYTSPRDPTRYDVRALDLGTGRLDPRRVIDPRESGEKMRGNPITRVTSRDGRWAYTLYDGAGATPFVHALDTEGRRARCIDLDRLAGRPDLWRLRLALSADGTELRVGRAAAIDLRTFRVAPIAAAARPDEPSPRWPWVAVAALALAVLTAAVVARRRGGPRRAGLAADVRRT